ncbi:unnamed protein product [Phytomonas sp. Hart1]|nr:unnamed protein product [Phytomonas sp. Hart1]|eukprot:CCW67705.1 unnamed protein product [Phytomonas sp. isolate Hart1]
MPPLVSSSTFLHSWSLPLTGGSPFTAAAEPPSVDVRSLSEMEILENRDDLPISPDPVLRKEVRPLDLSPFSMKKWGEGAMSWVDILAINESPSGTLRKTLSLGAKLLFKNLTDNCLDDFIEIVFVKDSWLTTDILFQGLCLVNRLTRRYPEWYQGLLKDDPPYTISKHSEDGEDRPGNGVEQIKWTESTSLRCFLAVLMLSNKFHSDVTYDTESVCRVVDIVREYQIEAGMQKTNTRACPTDGVYLRQKSSHLNQCELRVWEALGCTVWVTPQEFNACGAYAHTLGLVASMGCQWPKVKNEIK